MADSVKTYQVGVDGGGTGCRATISDSHGKRLASCNGGRANIATNFDLAITNVLAVVSSAGKKAGVSERSLHAAHIHIGLAGVMSNLDAARVKVALPYLNCTVTDDRPTTVTGALGESDGFLLSIGTGTIIASLRDRQFGYIGGWGFYLSDQASGAWLGHQALRQTILVQDGLVPPSDLSQTLMNQFENDPNALVAFSVAAKPGDYAKLAPTVIKAADARDSIAVSLMSKAVSYLENGMRALNYCPGDRLCITGGIGRFYGAWLANEFTQNICPPLGTAVDGALQLAAQAQVRSQSLPQTMEGKQ